MAKILEFPNRDPYRDLTEKELAILLRASISIASKRTARAAGVLTITPHVPGEAS